MKNIKVKPGFFLLMIIGLGTWLLSIKISAQDSVLSAESADNLTIPSGCTVFTIAKGESVYFGGNDDYINPDSYYWVDPGDSTNYGVIWIGEPDNVQQGVNEKGLAYDANGLPRVDVNPHSERIPVSGGYSDYPIQIMHECSTVEEVIKWINTHQWHTYMHDQMQFADATGDAVIISAGKDGELVFTRKPSGDGFLVSTNFNVANTANSYGYPCWRYDRAQEMLGQLVKNTEQLTATDATSVLEAVHVEKGSSWTIESLVADLVNGIVYLYYYHQFDRPIVLNVKDELSNPREAGPLSILFPVDVQQEANRRYNQAQTTTRINKIVGISWIAIILVSFVLFFTIPADNKRGYRFWIPSVVVLGPVALLVRLIVVQSRKEAVWRRALVETVGDLVPAVASFIVALIVLILIMISRGAGWPLQIILMFGLPLFAGWLVFHGLLLAPVSQKNYGQFLIQRLPQVLVTSLLGLAGIFAIVLAMINQRLNMVQLLPLFLTCWAIVVLGALAGGFLIFLYEHWAVKRGFQAWTILAGNEGQVITPSWRKLWWWILISLVVLFNGLIAGVMLQKMMAG
jgi:hypothetical protein